MSTPTRRPSEEVRSLLLDAARELFETRGYDGTTTKEISLKSGVSERLLFSNFGSKAELFDVAIITPFAQVIADYIASWEREAPGLTPEMRINAFVEGLFELAQRNRATLRSALARANRSERELLDHLATAVQSMQEVSDTVRDRRGYRIDSPATIAAATAMVFGMALLDDLLFPAAARRPSRRRLTTEMTQMILHGVLHRADGGGAAGS
jgi:AcrR family transcriptional regulator